MLSITTTTSSVTSPLAATTQAAKTEPLEEAPAVPLTEDEIKAAEAEAKALQEAQEAAAKADKELREDLEKALKEAQEAAEKMAEEILEAQEKLAKELAEEKIDVKKRAELQEKLTLVLEEQKLADESLVQARDSLTSYHDAKNPPPIASESTKAAGLVVEATIAGQAKSLNNSIDVRAEPSLKNMRSSYKTLGQAPITTAQYRFEFSLAPLDTLESEARLAAEMARSAAKYAQVLDELANVSSPKALSVLADGTQAFERSEIVEKSTAPTAADEKTMA